MKKVIALLLLSLILATLLTACGNKLSYDLDGGTLATTFEKSPSLQDIVNTVPTKEGFVFAGWYGDEAFTDYIDPAAITEAQAEANCAYAKWITVPASAFFDIRKDSATITDSGRANQKMDMVPLSRYYNVTDLKRAGYSSFKVTVSLSLCEVDDGYQYIFLYKNAQCKDAGSVVGWIDKNILGNDDDPYLIYAHKYEHTPGAADGSWDTVSFETVITLDQLEQDLYLRYGASGNSDDTWRNKDVSVEILPQKP